MKQRLTIIGQCMAFNNNQSQSHIVCYYKWAEIIKLKPLESLNNTCILKRSKFWFTNLSDDPRGLDTIHYQQLTAFSPKVLSMVMNIHIYWEYS